MITQDQWNFLEALHEEGERFDREAPAGATTRRNITFQTGQFLYQLVKSSAARRIVEVGTSNGCSTLWLALAARTNQGHVTTIDISAQAQEAALGNLDALGLGPMATLVCQDAGEWLAAQESSPVDFLFLDADRGHYPAYWPHISRMLRPGGLVVMDNALSHESECRPFVEMVRATPGWFFATYPVGKGQFVILKDE
ncbi:O-methyltransferase [Paludibacterium paludis]|uniref:O-methyltransferase n=1 Tax=Paludibacterium paludis TaxID=1225769 RepID=A0A918P5F3_9NEIS|nr:class I SAM-dependent methyltransferase [Paludibacterium paludis]GGY22568.1 O-methyltransferase [Paludibacterium paludis]